MKNILKKCTAADFEYLSTVLDSYLSFTDDSLRKKLVASYSKNGDNKELISLIDKQVRYYGSSDLAYLTRSLLSNGDGGIPADELVQTYVRN
jgi:hypothetical protein